MRITNKIIQNNSLNNINTNKVLADRLNTQMSTQKKIDRPSDDPVVAIRALRLRSNVSEVTQYYSKNIPDAESWLSVTSGALSTLTSVVTDMYSQCTKGSSGELTSTDRNTILEKLKALRDEVYATGDADYAGRYVFTGYRTNTSLSFGKETTKAYEITEQIDKNDISDKTFVKTVDSNLGLNLTDVNEANFGNYETAADSFTEQDVEAISYHRIRLAYKENDATVPSISYTKADGTTGTFTVGEVMDSYDLDANNQSAYELINTAAYDDKMILLKDTGELLLGKNVYNALMDTKDNPSTAAVNEGEIRVTYEKSNWAGTDLRPEHYFACFTDKGTADEIKYNQDYLDTNKGSTQVIEYDVGYNQTIRVNTTADECFNHDIGREVDDLIRALEDTTAMEKNISDLKKLLESKKDTADEEAVQKLYDAASKAYSLMKDSTQKMFEHGISAMQGYLDTANLAVTNNGTYSQKLSLIKNRMQTQKTTIETLKSENEDIDIADVTIQLSSAEVTYEASLMASAKVMKASLLNYL